ncbi:MAG: hypothetical protein LBN74_06225, partial [Prevotella sp.]|nr:hypothetical protein [Prevotella sp.]
MKFIGAIGIPIEMIKSLYFNKIYKHIKKRLLFLLLICPILLPAQKISTDRINWASFLSQHDLVWNAIKPDYYSGAIMGNGLLGVNIYADKEDKSYHWDIGRSDVTENRGGVNTLYDQARLPIGYFKLIPEGEVLSENMRLSLWDAVTQGRIETDKGDISFRTYVDANREVIVIDTDGNFKWSWVPGQAVSSRTTFAYTRGGTPEQYLNNPNPQVELLSDGAFDYSIQRLFSGWVYVTAWHRYTLGDVRRTLVTVSYKRNVDEAISEAKAIINDYKAKRAEAVENEHKQWWHNYYPASYATFSNTMMESFYWIQQYKLACLTRQDKNIIDLMGPWTDKTPWPAIWWNLNVQLTYSPLFTANRLELSKPLWDAFDKRLQSLIDNVPVEDWRKDAAYIGRSSSYDLVSPARVKLVESNQYEVGNLTWVLYYYWQYCTYKADDSELLNKFYPLLKRSIAYYDHILYKGEDGKLHLPVTASPEYKPAPDCNYDLSLLRWGLTTLLDVNKQYKL